MKKYIIFIFLISFFSLEAQLDRSQYYSYGSQIFTDVHTVPSTPDSLNLVITFKMSHNTLNFKKGTEGRSFGKFIAPVTAEIKIISEEGIIKSRFMYKDTIIVSEYYETISKLDFAEGFYEVILENSEYTVEIEFSTKDYSNESKRIHKIKKIKGQIHDPIFIQDKREDKFQLNRPYILNKSVSFSSDGCRLIFPFSGIGGDDNYSFKITKENNKNLGFLVFRDEIDYKGELKYFNNLVEFKYLQKQIYIDLDQAYKYENEGFLQCVLPKERISPGDYKIIIERNNDLVKEFEFQIIWEDIPLSLKDLDFAVKRMNYITSSEEQAKLESGSESERIFNFIEYWKSYDPTPLTIYNEAMYQYYSRVDYAFFNFQTIRIADGSKTDQGKVFILYSFPDEIREDFENGKNVVIWTYEKLKKRYTFEMVNIGDYRLSKIEEL